MTAEQIRKDDFYIPVLNRQEAILRELAAQVAELVQIMSQIKGQGR